MRNLNLKPQSCQSKVLPSGIAHGSHKFIYLVTHFSDYLLDALEEWKQWL